MEMNYIRCVFQPMKFFCLYGSSEQGYFKIEVGGRFYLVVKLHDGNHKRQSSTGWKVGLHNLQSPI